MRRLATLVLLALTLSVVAAAAPAGADEAIGDASTDLSAAEEVPTPRDRDGSGWARIITVPVTGMLCYVIVVEDILLPAVGAHIHVGPPGVAGPIVVPLENPNEGGISGGCIETVRPELLANIHENPEQYYMNVHTTEDPSGAVRGQLEGEE